MTTPHYSGTKVFHAPAATDTRLGHVYVDPWRCLCEHCQLLDCCRTSGDVNPVPTNRTYPDCLIWLAAVAGKTPEQALQEAERGD